MSILDLPLEKKQEIATEEDMSLKGQILKTKKEMN